MQKQCWKPFGRRNPEATSRQFSFSRSDATYTTETRLARWLLMCDDRLDGDDIAVTHEFLSMMLGVQRGGATIAVQTLEGSLLIKARRGCITIRDREGLIRTADGSYGVPEAEYARLIEGA